jgi:uncharacterized protein YkwD
MPAPTRHVDVLSMEDRPSSAVLRTAARTALAGLIVALAVAPAAMASPRAACPTADTPSSSVKQVQKAMLCLHNAERRAHGLSQMRWNGALAGAANGHARDMVARHYFAHVSAAGRDHLDRIAASGYRPGAACWTAGENLLFTTGPSTPRQLFAAWMSSAAHRHNIQHPGWQDFAVGVVATAPQGNPGGLTLVALFGTHWKHQCG